MRVSAAYKTLYFVDGDAVFVPVGNHDLSVVYRDETCQAVVCLLYAALVDDVDAGGILPGQSVAERSDAYRSNEKMQLIEGDFQPCNVRLTVFCSKIFADFFGQFFRVANV